ncbi:MAG: hypothetical protein HXY44_18085, partial [Syntrophaceae bacterium]|nr:hypothetical protein [Syntrophaceae bacterium]
MSRQDSASPNNQEILKDLQGKYLCARKRLQQARSKWQRRKLQEHVDDLKMDLAWAL